MRQAVQQGDRLPQFVDWPGMTFSIAAPQGPGFCGSMI